MTGISKLCTECIDGYRILKAGDADDYLFLPITPETKGHRPEKTFIGKIAEKEGRGTGNPHLNPTMEWVVFANIALMKWQLSQFSM